MTLRAARTLVVSAWLPEQDELRAAHPESTSLSYLLTGIGPLCAAQAVASALASAHSHGRPFTRVAFVGTAGAYDLSAFPLLSAWTLRRAVFTDGGAARGESYFPFPGGAPGESRSAQPYGSDDGPICVCPPSVTSSAALASALSKFGALENLEVAGLAHACGVAGVPWEAHLGVSNVVGEDSHAQWKAHHAAASAAAQQAFKLGLF